MVAEMVALGSGQTPFGKMGCKESGYCPRMIVPMMPPMAPASVVCGPVSATYLAEGWCPISASLGPCVMALWMA
jgi:hypothetical protein